MPTQCYAETLRGGKTITTNNMRDEKDIWDFEDGADEESFVDFIESLTTSDKNDNACSIDNPDCEGCGS